MSSAPQPVHWIKFGLDFTSCLVLFLIFQALKIFAKPFKSSFYCNDYSIAMPFKHSTVTNGNLILIAGVFPFILIGGTELVRSYYAKKFPSPTGRSSTRFVYKIRCLDRQIMDVSERFGNLYINCGAFFFGLASVAIITDFTKVVVGRLRPNFLDVCQPNVDPYKDLCAKYNRTYLVPGQDFKCMSRDLPSIEESRLSFPSGHSSLGFYSMVFLIFFIQHTWKCSRLGLMPRLVQLCLFILAVFIALSRIVDNKHHPTDVLAGTTLGVLAALLTFRYLTDLLKRNNYRVVHCFPPMISGSGSASASSDSRTLDDQDDIEQQTTDRFIMSSTTGNQTLEMSTPSLVAQIAKETFNSKSIDLKKEHSFYPV